MKAESCVLRYVPRPMTRTVLASALLAALAVGACGPAAHSEPPVTPVTPPTGEPGETPAPSPYDAARAEVTRLTALADKDPLLAPWSGPYGGVPPWDQAKVELVPPALALGIQLQAAEIDVIAENPAAPTFQNTLVAYEAAGRHLQRAQVIFDVMNGNLKTPEVEALSQEWRPKLAAAYDDITFNAKLFGRIKAVYESPDYAKLSAEEQRVVKLTYERLVQAGASLSADEKARVGEINQKLAALFDEFENKLLADENTWTVLESEADLAGLSPSLVAGYKAAADEHKIDGKWLVMNTRSSVDPFLAESSRRDLRETVWKKFKNRGDNGDANDTNATIAKIVKLRADRAKILGYKTHAHYRMADTMAVDPEKAKELMMRVWPAAVARVNEEVADMAKSPQAKKDKIKTIEPWDYLYYAEKVRKQKYDLDAGELKPYFELNNMIAAAMYMAEQLYGLQFTEITGKVPVFHADVRVWEVKDKASGRFVGLFYGDYFARAGKKSGAWMSPYWTHENFLGHEMTPVVSNNNNFVAGAPGEPVLISLDDAETLFHEFGHAIHYLLSDVNHPALSETPRDFVEYPSQVHEMWVLTRPILDRFAKHYKTGKPMPQALVDKVEKSRTFNEGYATVEYLSSAIVDMELHTIPDGVVDPDAFERDTLVKIGAPKQVAMRHRLPQFAHLFSSDAYSAGYYSYLWAEVMDADTRLAFIETGDVFDPATAAKMKKYILAPGNTTDRGEAYRQFRGRDPDVTAYLKKHGFPVK